MAENWKSGKEMNLPAYEWIKEEKLDELNSLGMIFRHKKSGARIAVISNDDDNKVFSIGFRTPPSNNTGVPHIIEHSVLCGSKEFPSKDPFVELVKGSLNTFLNAMTYSDKTIYPIASCNEKDFANLMHVYMDAVFYPNIYKKEEIFEQEGWHYELEEKEQPIRYNGVVYNEMKGVFSSPEQQLFRLIQQSLFPDTAYGNESGGAPEEIPNLTYEEFLDFHRKYYHPSNSYIYLYGDMDVEEKLAWMDEKYLSHFENEPVDSEIKMQHIFSERKEITDFYSVTEPTSDGDYLSYNVVIDTSLERKLYLAFQILEYALLSTQGAPLKQALIDAGIGKDVLSSYDNGILQPVFSIIAKNTSSDKKDAFVKVIQDTLSTLIQKGIDEKSLYAAINHFEFKYREADFGSYPKGLMYGIQMLDSWLYDDEKPFIHLKANDTFAYLKEQVSTGYYEKLLETYLLHNPHASIVIVKPKEGLTGEIEERTQKELEQFKASLSDAALEKLIEKTRRLKKFQETPSTQEELEKIPMLKREDIDKKIKPLQNKETTVYGIPVLHHEMFTNEIGYLRLEFDMGKVENNLLPLAGLLSNILGGIDTENYSYREFSNEINLHTGGIFTNTNVYTKKDREDDYCIKFEVSAKVLYGKISKAFELIAEMIKNSSLSDTKRLLEIIRETKSRLQMRLMSQGHAAAVKRATSYFSGAAVVEEQTNGITFYRVLEKLEKDFETQKENLVRDLSSLLKKIFRPENLLISYTASKEGFDRMTEEIPGFTDLLYKEESPTVSERTEPVCLREGFQTSGKVQYVAVAGNFLKKGYRYHGALKVLKVILSYDYLWNEIRVKGGAYGCMCEFFRDGNGYLTSYRDPHLEHTVEVYRKASEYIRNFTVSERDMTKYIIGAISAMDTPLNPAARGKRSLSAYFMGITEEELQRERDEVLQAEQNTIRSLADVILSIADEKNLCVIGNAEKIERRKKMFLHIDKLN